MKKLLLLIIVFFALAPITNAQDSKSLVETGDVLLFPDSMIGPYGTRILKFVVLGVEEKPTVDLDTGSQIIKHVEVVTVNHQEDRFSGFFYIPDDYIRVIWINEFPVVRQREGWQ
jgi:hypothetical protein